MTWADIIRCALQHKKRKIESQIYIDIPRHIPIDRQINRQAARQTDQKTGRKHTDIKADKQIWR